MTPFAKGTNVSVEKSRAALDVLLQKHGASSRVIGQDDIANRAVIGFSLNGSKYRLAIPLPDVRTLSAGRRVMGSRVEQCMRQAHRERWRLVILLVKSKLEAIRLGLSTAPREFMADMVTEDGRTLEEVLTAGDTPRLLLTAGTPPNGKGKHP